MAADQRILEARMIESEPDPSSAQPILVRFQNVSKVYSNGHSGLERFNLQVRQGEFLFVTGPSGSGKSTFLKLLYGTEHPDEGKITFKGQDISHLQGDRLAMLRRQLGIVFQDYKLLERRTVTENIALVLRTQGVAAAEIERRIDPALKVVGLRDKAHAFPNQLSGGEQQRVGIARAIIGSPTLLLADEPTGNLDEANAQQVLKLLLQFNTHGMTVIVTTHDMKLIQSTSARVVELGRGRLKRDTPAAGQGDTIGR
jgi:cell division transport system ATP-binding protein